jgi:hypothetical protein
MNPLEFEEQVALVQYLELKGYKFTAIPNSTYTKSIQQKMKNKRSGLRPGLPDLLVVVPNIGLVFIELKRVKGGVVSQAQKDWIAALNSCPGVEAVVCKGAQEAIDFLESLTIIKPTIGASLVVPTGTLTTTIF